jgi:hypothetical protein
MPTGAPVVASSAEPANAEANSLKNAMDEAVQDKVQVTVGVRIQDVSSDHSCQQEGPPKNWELFAN